MPDFENIIYKANQQNAEERAKKESSDKPKSQRTDDEKKQYGAEMAEKRKSCYDMIEQACADVATNVDAMRTLLDVQSRFDRYSINNNLLIMMQNPEATELRVFRDWKKVGGYVVDNPDKILMLEPKPYKDKATGERRTGYNIKEAIDINDVKNVQPRYRMTYKDYGENAMIAAVLDKCPVPVERTEQNLGDTPAVFSEKDRKIYYNRCSDFPKIFTALAQARAHVEMQKSVKDYRVPDHEFHAKCAANIVAAKYGIDTQSVEIFSVPSKFSELKGEEIKKELEKFHQGARDVSSVMRGFFEKEKEKAAKEATKSEVEREDR